MSEPAPAESLASADAKVNAALRIWRNDADVRSLFERWQLLCRAVEARRALREIQ